MANFQGQGPRIDVAQVRKVTADQAFLDNAVASLTNVIERSTAALASRLSANGYDRIRHIVKLDDAAVKDQDRKAMISTAATTEAATLMTQAQADLAAAVNLNQASSLGLDASRVSNLLDRMLTDRLKAAVENTMIDSHKEIVKLRDDFRSNLNAEAKKIARDVSHKVALDLEQDDQRELRTLLNTRRIGLPSNKREILLDKAAIGKSDDALQAAVQELEKRVPPSSASALGLDPATEKGQATAELSKAMQCAIKSKLQEGYDHLCEESKIHARAKSNGWGWAKVLAPTAIAIATGATIAVIGGTSAIFWVPTGMVVAGTAFLLCRWGQKAAQDHHLK